MKLILLVAMMFVMSIDGCGRRVGSNRKCLGYHRSRHTYPFYFGTTNLHCMNGKYKGKRDAPSRHVHRIAHRWLYYRGKYFEFFVGSNGYAHNKPVSYYQCSTEKEDFAAGYGVLSLECMKGCAANYKYKYGSYSTLGNNCHHFANTMAHILCHYNYCPSWCT